MIRFALIALMTLTACSDVQTATDQLGRDAAKKSVAIVVATRLPGVPQKMVTPVTDCVIDNARATEVRSLAKATIIGVDEGTVKTVTDIVTRPETGSCIAKAGLASLSS